MYFRWLIDTDNDVAGMRVIADLHGGNLNDPVAVAEFNEIKHKVQQEVIQTSIITWSSSLFCCSVNLAKAGRTE